MQSVRRPAFGLFRGSRYRLNWIAADSCGGHLLFPVTRTQYSRAEGPGCVKDRLIFVLQFFCYLTLCLRIEADGGEAGDFDQIGLQFVDEASVAGDADGVSEGRVEIDAGAGLQVGE